MKKCIICDHIFIHRHFVCSLYSTVRYICRLERGGGGGVTTVRQHRVNINLAMEKSGEIQTISRLKFRVYSRGRASQYTDYSAPKCLNDWNMQILKILCIVTTLIWTSFHKSTEFVLNPFKPEFT